MSGFAAISGNPLGALEDELQNLAAIPVTPAISNFIRKRVRVAMLRAGEDAILVRGDPITPTASASIFAVFRMTMSEQMAGEFRQNDMDCIVDPESVRVAGFPTPLEKNDRVIRWPGDLTKERVFTFVESPMAFVVGDEDVLYRGRVRG